MADSPKPGSCPAPLRLHIEWGTAAVAGYAPIGMEAADYEQHVWGPWPVPEVAAHHAEHWPTIAQFEGFEALLTCEGFDPSAVTDLVEAFGLDCLSFGSHRDPHAAGAPALQRARSLLAARAERSGISVLDAHPALPTVTHHAPEAVPDSQWMLRLPLGYSCGWNRAEGPYDQLDASGLIDRFTRVVALGGIVELILPLTSDGSLPADRTATVLTFAQWFNDHRAALWGVERFDVAGDDDVRYTSRPGEEPGTRVVNLIDLRHRDHLTIGHFSPHRYPMLEVGGCKLWKQDSGGIHLISATRTELEVEHALPTVHRLTIRDKRTISLSVVGQRTPGVVSIGDASFASIGAALAAAKPGDIVEVAAGRTGIEDEPLPLVVGPGVTLRGTLTASVGEAGVPPLAGTADEGVVLDLAGVAPATPAILLAGENAALEGFTIRRPLRPIGAEWDTWPVVEATDAPGGRIERCAIRGDVTVSRSDGFACAWNRITFGGISIDDSDLATVTGNVMTARPTLDGDRDATGVRVAGGHRLRVDGNHLAKYELGIELVETVESTVSGNDVSARLEGIVVSGSDGSEATANYVRAMRGLVIDRAVGATVAANTFVSATTGVMTTADSHIDLGRNRFDDCVVEQLNL